MGFFDSVVTVVSSAAHGDPGKAGHDLAAASAIGIPLGEFYASFARHYGDAAMGTLDHLNKAIDDLQKVAHDPQVLHNQLADMVKDHYGKATIELGVQDGTHANGDAAAPAAEQSAGNAADHYGKAAIELGVQDGTHASGDVAAPTAEQSAGKAADHYGKAAIELGVQDGTHDNGDAAAPTAEQSDSKAADHYGKAAIELGVQDGTHDNGDAAAPTAEQSDSKAADHYGKAAIELGVQDGTHDSGDAAAPAHAAEAAAVGTTVSGNHAAESAIPQPLPPSGAEAATFEGHDVQTLQNALNGISFSALALDGADAGQADGAEAGKIVIGGQEMALDSLMDGALRAPVCDHDMLPHVEMPSLLELHAAHLAHQLV